MNELIIIKKKQQHTSSMIWWQKKNENHEIWIQPWSFFVFFEWMKSKSLSSSWSSSNDYHTFKFLYLRTTTTTTTSEKKSDHRLPFSHWIKIWIFWKSRLILAQHIVLHHMCKTKKNNNNNNSHHHKMSVMMSKIRDFFQYFLLAMWTDRQHTLCLIEIEIEIAHTHTRHLKLNFQKLIFRFFPLIIPIISIIPIKSRLYPDYPETQKNGSWTSWTIISHMGCNSSSSTNSFSWSNQIHCGVFHSIHDCFFYSQTIVLFFSLLSWLKNKSNVFNFDRFSSFLIK